MGLCCPTPHRGQRPKTRVGFPILAPGPFWTPLQPSGGQPPEKIPSLGQQVPLGPPGQPAKCAPIYVLLAGQESSYVTSEVYGVTGGNHLP